ncbi:MAG: hypothetical protein KA144_03145 [Xanthomonadaceae bacterium]|nr:hypothetical protein [Xanthomonadaceae bacterium]
MSKDRELRRMRMDLLRTRATLERADVADALQALRDAAGRLRTATTTLKGLGSLVSTLSGRGGGLAGFAAREARARGARGMLATVVDQAMRRPWLAALALKGLRSFKRRPAVAVAVVVGVTVATLVARRRRDPSDDMFSAPMG